MARKNVQRTVRFKMVDATDFATPKPGRAASCNPFVCRDSDSKVFIACSNKVSEVSHGWYQLVLIASEMNSDEVALKVSDGGTSAQMDRLIVTDSIQDDTSELQGDWANTGRLDTILDELTTQGDTNEAKLATIQADTSELQADWTDAGRLDAILDLIRADTSELQGDWVDAGRLDAILDLIRADTSELQGDWTDTGRLDTIIDSILADTGELQVDDIPGTLATIQADTSELQADWANAGRLDTLLDACSTHNAAAVKTAMEAAGSDLDYLMIALVNKQIITKANGNAEQFNDAGGSLGTIAGAITSDATTVTRLRMVQ